MKVSFLGLLGDDSSFLDLDLFDVLAQASLDSLDDVLPVSLEGVDVSAPSQLELGVLCVLLDEDSYLASNILLLALDFDLSLPLLSFSRARNSLGFLISLG